MVRVRDVLGELRAAAASVLDALTGLAQRALVQVHDQGRAAEVCDAERGRAADAGPRAGDDEGSTVER